jgi:hypothetical protein
MNMIVNLQCICEDLELRSCGQGNWESILPWLLACEPRSMGAWEPRIFLKKNSVRTYDCGIWT